MALQMSNWSVNGREAEAEKWHRVRSWFGLHLNSSEALGAGQGRGRDVLDITGLGGTRMIWSLSGLLVSSRWALVPQQKWGHGQERDRALRIPQHSDSAGCPQTPSAGAETPSLALGAPRTLCCITLSRHDAPPAPPGHPHQVPNHLSHKTYTCGYSDIGKHPAATP